MSVSVDFVEIDVTPFLRPSNTSSPACDRETGREIDAARGRGSVTVLVARLARRSISCHSPSGAQHQHGDDAHPQRGRDRADERAEPAWVAQVPSHWSLTSV